MLLHMTPWSEPERAVAAPTAKKGDAPTTNKADIRSFFAPKK